MPCDLGALLAYAKENGASDLHISAGLPPMLRVRGAIVRLKGDPISPDEARQAIHTLLGPDLSKSFEDNHDLDCGLEIHGIARVRANFFTQQRGPGAAFRLIPSTIKTLDELEMPSVLKELALKERGLVIVTGPTGSGKSTTLAAMVDYINENRSAHIVTLEDPIEFVHVPKNCLVHQREVGAHTASFAVALRAALREDPDIIMVGELRDLETTQLAITAAETGHLVLCTLHTNSAHQTIDRIIDIFPGDQQSQVRTMLSESLEGIVAQTLLPNRESNGRVAALEILIGVPALRNLIREDKMAQIPSLIQTGAQYGMQTLDQSLLDLIERRKITGKEAVRRSGNPRLLENAGASVGPQRPTTGPTRPGPTTESPERPGLRR